MEGVLPVADHLHPPLEDVSDRGLSGLDPVVAGKDGALDDAANAGNVGHGLAGRHDAAVAGRGPDHLDERPLGDAATDCAVVDVELSDRDWNAGRQPEALCPGGAKRSGGLGRIVRLLVEPVAQRGEPRIEEGEKLPVGEASPFIAIKRLVPRCAHAALHFPRVGDAGQKRGHPIGEFHPRIGGLEHLRIDRKAVKDLRPEPFRGIGVAAFCDILRPAPCSHRRDAGGLAPGGVVLPQPALRGEVAGPFSVEGQRPVVAIDRDRAGAGRVDAKADDLRGVKPGLAAGLRKGGLDAAL